MKHQIISITVTVLLKGGGCSRKVTDSGVELNGEAAKAGSPLAYEHTARISLAEDSTAEAG
ncbi:MAG: hypothetical protein ABIR16_04640 [Dokdonella sp.]